MCIRRATLARVAAETAVVAQFLVMPAAAQSMALELRGRNETVHFVVMWRVNLDKRCEQECHSEAAAQRPA